MQTADSHWIEPLGTASMIARTAIASLLGLSLYAMAASAVAQAKTPERRLYCWDEGGRRVCGDALPASAVDRARTEINARSGMRVGEVPRALNAEERAAAAVAETAARRAAETAEVVERRERAMVESYATEDDLRRGFGERIILVDEALKTSRMSIGNLRQSLLSLLRQASDLELQGKPVQKTLSGNILAQHNDLLRQKLIMEEQTRERSLLDAELEHALERYRAIKQPGPG